MRKNLLNGMQMIFLTSILLSITIFFFTKCISNNSKTIDLLYYSDKVTVDTIIFKLNKDKNIIKMVNQEEDISISISLIDFNTLLVEQNKRNIKTKLTYLLCNDSIFEFENIKVKVYKYEDTYTIDSQNYLFIDDSLNLHAIINTFKLGYFNKKMGKNFFDTITHICDR